MLSLLKCSVAAFAIVGVVAYGTVIFKATHPAPPPTVYPNMLVIDMIGNQDANEHLWKAEIARRFPNAVVVFCHGGDFLGTWVMVTLDGHVKSTVAEAWELRNEFPHRPIVFVTCNPGHYKLNVPGVYHALDNMWLQPDNTHRPDYPVDPGEHPVGNVYELTDDRPELPY